MHNFVFEDFSGFAEWTVGGETGGGEGAKERRRERIGRKRKKEYVGMAKIGRDQGFIIRKTKTELYLDFAT